MKRKIVLSIFSLLLSFGIAAAKDNVEKIIVSTDSIASPYFVGAGVQWSAYPHADSDDSEWGMLMTDKKWDTLYERVDYMKPRFMRVIDQANWRYFEKLDENGQPILNFDNQEINSLYKILDYCQKNNIVVMLGEWGVPGHRHDKDKSEIHLRDVTDMRWHKMIGEWVDFLLNKKGYTCIKYYDFINEPNGNWSCVEGDFAQWAVGVKLLHEEFARRGLTDKIEICGPGSVPNFTAPLLKERYKGNMWVDYASEVVGDILGAYNTHAYYPHLVVRDGRAAEYMYFKKDIAISRREKKPFFLGEIGLKATKDGGEIAAEHERRRLADGYASGDSNMFIYDYFFGLDIVSAAVQSINAGVDGLAAWDMDDAMHTKDDTADKMQIKRWGFWNILGTELYNNPDDEKIRPWYWAWSWVCRYLPPASQVYAVTQPSNHGCQLLVAKVDGGYSVLAVNTSDKDVSIEMQCSEIPALTDVNKLTYNEQYAKREKPYDVGKIKKFDMSKGAQLQIPAKTFIVLTTAKL